MSRAAIRYAKAILDIAQVQGTAVAVNADMQSIFETIDAQAELSDFLQNPTVKVDGKAAVLKQIFQNVQPQTLGLFRLLEENKRFGILKAICAQYKVLFDQMNGNEVAKVTTAVAMTAATEQLVLEKIKSFSKNNITIENIIDPSIIGGFIISMGDKQFNASVAHKLQQLKREFSN
jgi:F-type H+-transporting ATPase subunit delta